MMKKIFILLILSISITGCDVLGSFTFKVKNSTQETITLKFLNDVSSGASHGKDVNKKEIVLRPTEEKTVRVLDAQLNARAHDCLTDHGIAYFKELVFDTYVNDEKLEKQLWQAENWTYQKKSEWLAEYNMTITNEMIGK